MKIHKKYIPNQAPQAGFTLLLPIVAVMSLLVVGLVGWRVVALRGANSVSVQTSNNQAEATNTGHDGAHSVFDALGEGGTRVETSDMPATTPTQSSPPALPATGGANSSGSSPGSMDTGGSGTPAGGGSPPAPVVKEFTVNMFSYGFSLSTLNVSPGDSVTINLTNSGGFHDFVISELGVASAAINSGGTTSVSFTVPGSAAGSTYEYFCSIGSHRAQGMVGSLIVAN